MKVIHIHRLLSFIHDDHALRREKKSKSLDEPSNPRRGINVEGNELKAIISGAKKNDEDIWGIVRRGVRRGSSWTGSYVVCGPGP